MKIIIGGEPPVCYRDISKILRELWAFHDIHIPERNIETKWNSFHKFWDVNVYRRNIIKTGYGHGTVEHQLAQWEKYKRQILDMQSELRMTPSSGWSWEDITESTYVQEGSSVVGESVNCPAFRMFLFEGTAYGV